MTYINKTKDEKRRYTYANLVGNCLERAGIDIPSGGIAIIDHNTEIIVGDFVICSKLQGQFTPFVNR